MAHTSSYSTLKVLPSNSVSQDKTKNLFKMQAVNANNKVFDKELKSKKVFNVAYVLDFTSASSKIIFPKEDRK